MKRTFFLSLLAGFLAVGAFAQSKLTEHTLALDNPVQPANADISQLDWLSGRWIGQGLGGNVEENWSPPQGGAMAATFQAFKDGQPQFYEICLIAAQGKSLVYKVKHFNPDLTGWEEKSDFVSFPLVRIEPGKAYFQGLTLELQGNSYTCYVAFKQKNGSYREEVFTFQRAPVRPVASLMSGMPKISKTPLLLLGTYHMSNPGADQFNLQSDDVLSPKRQAEIEEVVDKLAAFRPTKIALEIPFGDTAILRRYQAFLNGNLELRRGEHEQIGFRLAKKLGHSTVFPIDMRMGLDFDTLQSVVAANPAKHGPQMAQMEAIGKGAIALMDQWLKEGTIRDMLFKMNSPEFLDLSYQLYLQVFLPMVEGTNFAGADLVADWNKRNLRIFSNLHQIGCSPDDRVLVIFGQGHIPLLERIARDSPYFEVVDVLSYLR